MRVLLQKVSRAAVAVDGTDTARIGPGYLLFLGVMQGDTEAEAQWLAKKISTIRLFEGANGTINDRTLLEAQGSVLVVSQFTLAGDLSRGLRPDYTAAAQREVALHLYTCFVAALREAGIAQVLTGEFGAHMDVTLTNDGPVTLWLDRLPTPASVS